mgnify:CR=1 FL=1
MMAMMAGLSKMMAPSMMGMAVGSDGRSHGHSGVRPVRPAASPARTPALTRAARQHRSVRRGVEHHRRRDADVGACSGTHGARLVLDQQSSRVVRRTGSETRRRSAPIPRPLPRSCRRSIPTKATRCRRCSSCSVIPPFSSALCSRPGSSELQPSLDAAAAAVIGYVDYMVDGVGAGDRWRRVADCRGWSGDVASTTTPERRVHRSGCWACGSRTSRRWQNFIGRRRRSRSAKPDLSSLARPQALPTRRRSTPGLCRPPRTARRPGPGTHGRSTSADGTARGSHVEDDRADTRQADQQEGDASWEREQHGDDAGDRPRQLERGSRTWRTPGPWLASGASR